MNLSVTDFIRRDNAKGAQGILRPSGRFSVVQQFNRKKKGQGSGKKIQEVAQGMRSVQQLDDTYSKLLRGDLSPLREVPPAQNGSDPTVGLSDELNSPKRAKRGSRGISARQRDILCWGATTLERIYGRANLSFLTYTLPALSASDLLAVKENWHEIVHRVVLRIKEKLHAQGIASSVAGCTELQLERFNDTGDLYPHLHLVFRGRQSGRADWGIRPHQFRAIWRRVVGRFLDSSLYNWRASENVESVRKSVGGYLAKYVSKCASKHVPGILNSWHPSDWIVLGRRVRGLYERMSYRSEELGSHLDSLVRRWNTCWGYVRSIFISSPAMGERRIGYYGWLKGEERYPGYAEMHPLPAQ